MKYLRKLWKDIRNFVTSKPWTSLALGVLALAAVVIVANYIANIWAFWDDAADRGATVVENDVYGDVARQIRYLDDIDGDSDGQGWKPKDTLWFDSVTQGSDLLPYDFFLVLEQPNGQLFRSNEHMNNAYRYLVRKPTSSNPDGLPIGFAKDNYQHKDFLGYTCAACHTNQINYKGIGIRIDGAPAMADMDTLLTDLAKALARTQTDPSVQARFVKNVMALGDYGSEDEVKADLQKYALRLATYRIVNRSNTHYGFARLDAFGRIYNQVLQYVLTAPDVDAAVSELIAEKRIDPADLKAVGFLDILKELWKKPVLDGEDRDRLLGSLAKLWETKGLKGAKEALYLRNKLFNSPDAPVSYPFVWDVPQHDYIQWNGIASNAGLGPIGRNTGEVIGVFGSMNWSRSDHWTLAGVFSGQGFLNTHPINYSSSVNIHNLALIEDHLKTLRAPVWPESVLGKIDQHKRWRGKVVFDRYCAMCHAQIDASDPARRIVAHMSAQDNVKTDPVMAVNSVGYAGYSGIVRNSYVTVGAGPLLLDRKAPVAALLTKTTTGVVATPDADKGALQRFVEWLYDVIFSLRNNEIQPSLKNGDYHPDTTAQPLASLVSYKGRALDGIWATAPYLHNGSVPNLYDLLLPAGAQPGDAPGTKYRPAKFQVGSREFDPHMVGFKSDGYPGFLFLTALPGNSNGGHDYGTRETYETNPDGTVVKNSDGTAKVLLPALTEDQRWDLVEYLKGL